MKKYILVFAFIWLTFASPAYAQVATEAKQDAYNQALVQLITLLQEQVKLLMDQLVAVQASQTTLTTQITQIAQNTTPSTQVAPTPVAPVYGNTGSQVTPEVKKEIKFIFQPTFNNGPQTKDNVNYWNVYAYYSENGQPKQATITVSSDKGSISNSGPQLSKCGELYGKKCWAYVSLSQGDSVATITATANGISATTTSDITYWQN